MNSYKELFAICGAKAHFEEVVPVGQLYFPSWDRYESAMRGIFKREYYTNNGPLLAELESKLQKFIGVKHAICVSNGTFGLMMAAEALELSGKVILPAFTFIASAQSLAWAGIEPVFCDVHRETHQIDAEKVLELIDDDVSAIMGVNLWGDSCDQSALLKIADKKNIKLYFDSAHAFGCKVQDKKIGCFGELEVFSFHATKILSATEGGCICTDNDDLADRLRSIRPSYSGDTPVDIVKVANARMSEAQAAIALMSLEDFESNRQNNENLFATYSLLLDPVPGINLLKPSGVSLSNYQYVVCEIDEDDFGISRDELIAVLKAENVWARRYFYPGIHRNVEFRKSATQPSVSLPNTDYLCDVCIQLPIGMMVNTDIVTTVCKIIDNSNRNADYLKKYFMQDKT